MLGCASVPPHVFDRGPEPISIDCCGETDGGVVELHYLGVGGWTIRTERGLLMTAPLFSNPSMLETGLSGIGYDSIRIVEGLRHVGVGELASTRAILTGHGHYDHLMDVPWIAARLAPEAVVLGNRTSRLQSLGLGRTLGVPEDRFVDVEPAAASATERGRWIDVGGGFRVLPILSDHAPHFSGITLYGGDREVEPEIPRGAADWLEGETLAWLIDVLAADGSVTFRIYYQDAVAREPRGGVPPRDVLGDSIPVDVAIIVPATYAEARWQPEWILENTDPEHVLLGHWEDFFRPATEPPVPVAFTLLPDFVSRLRRATECADRCWSLPEPGTVYRFR